MTAGPVTSWSARNSQRGSGSERRPRRSRREATTPALPPTACVTGRAFSLGPTPSSLGPRRSRHPGPITRPQTLTTSTRPLGGTVARRWPRPPSHIAVHGSARPAGTLGFATPTRPDSLRPDPDSDDIRVTQGHVAPDRSGPARPLHGLGRHCRTRTGASAAGDLPIVDVQKHHSGRYGVLVGAATMRTSPDYYA